MDRRSDPPLVGVGAFITALFLVWWAHVSNVGDENAYMIMALLVLASSAFQNWADRRAVRKYLGAHDDKEVRR